MRYLIAFSFAAVFVSSCKKESPEPSISEILVASKWKLAQLLLEAPVGSIAADITLTTFKPCELDDVIEFKAGGSFSCSEYKDVCPGNNNSLFYKLNAGNWQLSNQDSLLTLQSGFNQQGFGIRKESTVSVKLYQQQKNYLDQLVKYTYVLKAVE